jgi:SAM-dependent methyltransferase
MATCGAEPELLASGAESAALREYRKALTTSGQTSPPKLAQRVVRALARLKRKGRIESGISVVDVGCGLGVQLRRIDSVMPGFFARKTGVDWSPATFEFHHRREDKIYDEVHLCDSARLPFPDKNFDFALSMENLEHLYSDGCIGAIRELCRIARYVLITTPWPRDCVNVNWLNHELREAAFDRVPMGERDFQCMESAVHKSTVYPNSMVEAGFSIMSFKHGIYFAASDKIDAGRIKYTSMEDIRSGNVGDIGNDLRLLYLRLLIKSLALNDVIPVEDKPLSLTSRLSFFLP